MLTNQSLWNKISDFVIKDSDHSFSFAQDISQKNNWSLDYANRAILEYKRFAYLSIVSDHLVIPSVIIGLVWKRHMTYTQNYEKYFCNDILNRSALIDFLKYKHLDRDQYKQAYGESLDSYTKEFSSQAPEDIWLRHEHKTTIQRAVPAEKKPSPVAMIKYTIYIVVAMIVGWMFAILGREPVSYDLQQETILLLLILVPAITIIVLHRGAGKEISMYDPKEDPWMYFFDKYLGDG